jgi:hypothetical protein
VRNHVKLSSCNHRFKDDDRPGTAVETAATTARASAGDCESAAQVESTWKGEDTIKVRSFHAECTSEGTLETAVLSADDTTMDWRKATDGHVMAKKIRHIEEEESIKERTGTRSTKQQQDWKRQLENAMRDEHTPQQKDVRYRSNKYDAASVDMRYDQFTTRANWNFGRRGRPVFRNYGTTVTATDEPSPFVIDPVPISPVTLDGTAYTRASPTFFRARLGDTARKPSVGLLDNCAAISLIDERLLQELQPTLYERDVLTEGVGLSNSSQFCVIPICIDVTERDTSGAKVKKRARIPVEFHVIKDLNESFVVGMDVIGPYQIDIMTSDAKAKIAEANKADIELER